MTRRRIIFTGHVQGVGFRATTKSIAARYSLTGWVRNDPDGAVTLELQGDPAEIETFLMEHEAQLGGYVQSKQDDTIDPVTGEDSFQIAH